MSKTQIGTEGTRTVETSHVQEVSHLTGGSVQVVYKVVPKSLQYLRPVIKMSSRRNKKSHGVWVTVYSSGDHYDWS